MVDWAPKAAPRKEQQKQCVQIVGSGRLSVAKGQKGHGKRQKEPKGSAFVGSPMSPP